MGKRVLGGVLAACVIAGGTVAFLVIHKKPVADASPTLTPIVSPILYPLPNATSSAPEMLATQENGEGIAVVTGKDTAAHTLTLRFIGTLFADQVKTVKISCPPSDSWTVTVTINRKTSAQRKVSISVISPTAQPLYVLADPAAGDNFSGICADSSCTEMNRKCILRKITVIQ